MTDEVLWQSIQSIWRESENPDKRREGRPSVAADIATLLFAGRGKGSKTVKHFRLDRPMKREAWFASLSLARQQNGQGNQPRKIEGRVVTVDALMAASERVGRLRRAG